MDGCGSYCGRRGSPIAAPVFSNGVVRACSKVDIKKRLCEMTTGKWLAYKDMPDWLHATKRLWVETLHMRRVAADFS